MESKQWIYLVCGLLVLFVIMGNNGGLSASRPREFATASTPFTTIDMKSGELVIPYPAGVILESSNEGQGLRVAGSSTTTFSLGTSVNQVQIYTGGNQTAAFEPSGVYLKDGSTIGIGPLKMAHQASVSTINYDALVFSQNGTTTMTLGRNTATVSGNATISGHTAMSMASISGNATIANASVTNATISNATVGTGTVTSLTAPTFVSTNATVSNQLVTNLTATKSVLTTVGIGTSTPAFPLDVVGVANINGDVTVSNKITTNSIRTISSVGIGKEPNSTYFLDVNGTINCNAFAINGLPFSTTGITSTAANVFTETQTITAAMPNLSLKNTATGSPAGMTFTDVSGGIMATVGGALSSSTNGFLYMDVTNGGSLATTTNTGSALTIRASGGQKRVGINNTNPQRMVHVSSPDYEALSVERLNASAGGGWGSAVEFRVNGKDYGHVSCGWASGTGGNTKGFFSINVLNNGAYPSPNNATGHLIYGDWGGIRMNTNILIHNNVSTSPALNIAVNGYYDQANYGDVQITHSSASDMTRPHMSFVKHETSVWGMGISTASGHFNEFVIVSGGNTSGPGQCMKLTSGGTLVVPGALRSSSQGIYGSVDTGTFLRIDNATTNTWKDTATFDATRYITVTGGAENTNRFQVGPGGVSIGNAFNPPIYTQTAKAGLVVQNNVGIGTQTPRFPLDIKNNTNYSPVSAIYGDGSTYMSVMNINVSQAQPRLYNVAEQYPISLYCGGYIICSDLIVFSDERIKTNIVPFPKEYALDVIRKLNPVSYQYKDKIEFGHVPHVGFIAQDIEKVLPYSVRKETDFIPNVFSLAQIEECDTGSILKLDKKVEQTEGTVLKIYIDSDKNPHEVTIQTWTDDTIFINETVSGKRAFLYGTRVSDKRTIDKDQIFTIAVSALQQIDVRVQSQQLEINELKEDMKRMKACMEGIMKQK
jgi:hypothetical protein